MGSFIAIEGGDGSGKRTQASLLENTAKKRGFDVLKVSFPNYGHDSAYYVEKYLNGKYGSNNSLPADLTSLPFAIDRFANRELINSHLSKPNSVVIADRYVASNLAHQGTKITDSLKRKSFYEQLMKTEYGVLGIPQPDINLVLLVSPEISQLNVDQKQTRGYTDQKRDLLEADLDHLNKTKLNYEELCDLYPQKFTPINCMDRHDLKSIESVASLIDNIVFDLLPKPHK